MARKKAHEDHANHEAWAIPYGDLVTLLLAFFVVMYATSSINEGKFRVLADAMSEAFGGAPKSLTPVQMGRATKSNAERNTTPPLAVKLKAVPSSGPNNSKKMNSLSMGKGDEKGEFEFDKDGQSAIEKQKQQLEKIAKDVDIALEELISKNLVVVQRKNLWIEIEIKADILFASGAAHINEGAKEILQRLSDVFATVPNPLRIEGHTDNVPISTYQFPSNWELSAARAASVVHLLEDQGLEPNRLSVVGQGEFSPKTDNSSPEARNTNRRVVIVVMGASEREQLDPESSDPELDLPPVVADSNEPLIARLRQ